MATAHYIWASLVTQLGFSGGSEGKASAWNVRRPGFDSWVRKIPWRRKWKPIPIPLPGKSHGQRSLVGYSPRGHKESDTTERVHFLSFLVAQLVKYLPAMKETWVGSLGWEDALEKGQDKSWLQPTIFS